MNFLPTTLTVSGCKCTTFFQYKTTFLKPFLKILTMAIILPLAQAIYKTNYLKNFTNTT